VRARVRIVALLAGVALWAAAARPAHAMHVFPDPASAPANAMESGTGAASGAVVWGCPMCATVRRTEPGTCPVCGMALVPMTGTRQAPAGRSPLMPGLPPWLFFTMALAVLVVSFVMVEARGRDAPPVHGARYDLLRLPGLGRLVRQQWFPPATQLPVVLLFVLVIAAGLIGNSAPDRNIAPILTWTIWWALLVLLVLFAGKLWCLVCPWMALADWAGRWVPRLGRPWPRALRSIWPATILFVGLTWLELGYGVTRKPWLTAVLGLGMLGLAVASVVVFERRAFCRYACLVGRVSGLYATFAPSELRAADGTVCRRCATRDCWHGNAQGMPCPTSQYLGTMRENTYCTLCLACVRSCPEGNVAWNLRPFGADLLESIRPRRDEAWLAVVLLSLTAFHGFTMTPAWNRLVQAIAGATGMAWLGAFSVGMAAMLVLPAAVYWGICRLMAWSAGDGRHTSGTLFVRFSYALLPIALFYHLAHNVQHILFESTKLVRAASDPFGWGWNIFGTAHQSVGALLPVEVGWALQVALVLVGHVYAIVIAHRTARSLYPDPRIATVSQLPMLTAMLLFSFQSLWLLSQPMLMRTGM
jgi:hypothetical protein